MCSTTTEFVHVWYINLDARTATLDQLTDVLSSDERARAARLFFAHDRQRFVVSRGVLRIILSSYCGLQPTKVCFSYGPYGKPALVSSASDACLRFNLTHSHSLALLAVAYGRELGIDIERVRSVPEAARIAEQFFSPHERIVMRGLPIEQQQHAFFRCWTRKEAYIKARGDGLSLPLDAFDVSFAPGATPALLADRTEPHAAARWSLHAVPVPPEYVAALVIEGNPGHIVTKHWDGQC